MNKNNASVFTDTKPHYEILDGLRGVAALLVVMFHLFETFSLGNHLTQLINHGYLAVDFFFALSGFVIGYAYDDRWQHMSIKEFFTRRLIRLHPMIIMGMLIGAVFFYFSASSVLFPQLQHVPIWKMLLVMLIGFTLIPVPKALDVRGWEEMFPLNGPAWSLFFEYVANIMYALILRKLPNKLLALLTLLSATATVYLAVFGASGDVIGGWSLDAAQLKIGFTRLLYPFLAGLLLSRVAKPTNIRNAFIWSSLITVLVLAFPRIGGADKLWINGIYDSVAILLVFPLVVYIGASGKLENTISKKICGFLGDISYPIYIIHYPLIYVFTAWVVDNKLSMQQALPGAILVFVVAVVMAYASLKLYDIPVRKWLNKRFIKR